MLQFLKSDQLCSSVIYLICNRQGAISGQSLLNRQQNPIYTHNQCFISHCIPLAIAGPQDFTVPPTPNISQNPNMHTNSEPTVSLVLLFPVLAPIFKFPRSADTATYQQALQTPVSCYHHCSSTGALRDQNCKIGKALLHSFQLHSVREILEAVLLFVPECLTEFL